LPYGSQNTNFLGRKKRDSDLVKNALFSKGFSSVVQPNLGVEVKERLF